MLISPGNIKLANLGSWEPPTSKSPALYVPPDINSKFNKNIRPLYIAQLDKINLTMRFYFLTVNLATQYLTFFIFLNKQDVQNFFRMLLPL